MENKKSYTVPAVEKAMLILEYLTESERGYNLREIHTALNIAKTTTFSTLMTLTQSGYVRKTSDGLFIPTLKLTMLGAKAREFAYDGHFLRTQLESLRDQTGFTVFFCAYDKGEQVVLEKVNGNEGVVFRAVEGERKHINTSSSGKAMAAYLSPQELQSVIDKGLRKLTVNSISDEDSFLTHLNDVRRQGYSVDDNEGEIGVRCIGAPVFTYGNTVYGAVSLTTLSENLPPDQIHKYAPMVQGVANEISKHIGYSS